MIDIHNLKKHNVIVRAISVNPKKVSYLEEKEMASILGCMVEGYRWYESDEEDDYILITDTMKRDKLFNPKSVKNNGRN